MARRRREEEHENHERWLVSYADFITLLFAFFVVMYAISSVNEGKYRVLSNTLTDAFVTSAQSLDPIQLGEPVRAPYPQEGEYAASTPTELPAPVAPPQVEVGPPMVLAEITEELEEMLSERVDENLVRVTQTERGVEVEMKSKMLFDSGSARLSRDALGALQAMAGLFKRLPNQINVEGCCAPVCQAGRRITTHGRDRLRRVSPHRQQRQRCRPPGQPAGRGGGDGRHP